MKEKSNMPCQEEQAILSDFVKKESQEQQHMKQEKEIPDEGSQKRYQLDQIDNAVENIANTETSKIDSHLSSELKQQVSSEVEADRNQTNPEQLEVKLQETYPLSQNEKDILQESNANEADRVKIDPSSNQLLEAEEPEQREQQSEEELKNIEEIINMKRSLRKIQVPSEQEQHKERITSAEFSQQSRKSIGLGFSQHQLRPSFNKQLFANVQDIQSEQDDYMIQLFDQSMNSVQDSQYKINEKLMQSEVDPSQNIKLIIEKIQKNPSQNLLNLLQNLQKPQASRATITHLKQKYQMTSN